MRALPSPRPAGRLLLLCLVWLVVPGAAAGESLPGLTVREGLESRELSLAEVERGGLHHLVMRHPEGPVGRFSGVWLDDLLADQGLDEARRVRFIAHDDYTTFLTPEQRREKAYLLLTRLDGEPIPLEALGPFMLVVPDDLEAVLAGTEPMTRWIWAIREISIR